MKVEKRIKERTAYPRNVATLKFCRGRGGAPVGVVGGGVTQGRKLHTLSKTVNQKTLKGMLSRGDQGQGWVEEQSIAEFRAKLLSYRSTQPDHHPPSNRPLMYACLFNTIPYIMISYQETDMICLSYHI